MKHRATGLVAFSAFVWVSAKAAHDSRCDAPPYGDTPENYSKVNEAVKGAAPQYASNVGDLLLYMYRDAFNRACRIKYEGADRTDFYRLGITDADIAERGTAALATGYVNLTTELRRQEAQAGNPPAPTTPSSSPSAYQLVTVRDFVIDGPKLASVSAKVKLIGFYIRQSGVEVLYANQRALIMATRSNSPTTQPSVPLLTDDAPHALRGKLLNCQSDPTAAQTGCQVTVQGEATMCGPISALGATRETPCVNVKDGQ
jgi:hypothetical protein